MEKRCLNVFFSGNNEKKVEKQGSLSRASAHEYGEPNTYTQKHTHAP